MRLILLFIIPFLISGCIIPNPFNRSAVRDTFPNPPPALMKEPAALKEIQPGSVAFKVTDTTDSGMKLSAVTKVITSNYATCNVYKEQVIGLQEWINSQLKLNSK